MGQSSQNGKGHVIEVYEALKNDLSHPTADYIKGLYGNILDVMNKYQTQQPDQHADLTLQLVSGESVQIQLFSITGNGAIQPKNLGARSFLGKYFNNETLQQVFNIELEYEWHLFYEELLKRVKEVTTYDKLSLLREKVRGYYPKFSDDINPIRSVFLSRLRDITFRLLKDTYNRQREGLASTFIELMLTDSINIVSRKNKSGIYKVEQWKVAIDHQEPLQIYKKGNETIGLRIGKHALTLRFKFESSPATSIKLATSFEIFPEQTQLQRQNLQSIAVFERTIEVHEKTMSKNTSNAIGKCNEAIVYYRLLKMNPSINQINEQTYQQMLNYYSPVVAHDVLLQLQEASDITCKRIKQYLTDKYEQYEIKSMELVPESYIKDRLDTTDLRLILYKDEKYIDEGLSLKAIANKNNKITVKNPGAGQILGPSYFAIGSLKPLLEEIKQQFDKKEKNHRECLEAVSTAFGEAVATANIEKIQRGITAILGQAPKVVTLYKMNECQIIETKEVANTIIVKQHYPSAIQTTFEDTASDLALSLRVKFSAGQSKGWSSIKFAGEMGV